MWFVIQSVKYRSKGEIGPRECNQWMISAPGQWVSDLNSRHFIKSGSLCVKCINHCEFAVQDRAVIEECKPCSGQLQQWTTNKDYGLLTTRIHQNKNVHDWRRRWRGTTVPPCAEQQHHRTGSAVFDRRQQQRSKVIAEGKNRIFNMTRRLINISCSSTHPTTTNLDPIRRNKSVQLTLAANDSGYQCLWAIVLRIRRENWVENAVACVFLANVWHRIETSMARLTRPITWFSM